jgi:hypothetical protein
MGLGSDLMQKWVFLTGDVNWKQFGAKWFKIDNYNDDYCYVIEIINFEDATGEKIKIDGVEYTYVGILYTVLLDNESAIKSALEVFGETLEDLKGLTKKQRIKRIAEAISSYGYPLDRECELYSNNADTLLAELKEMR